MGASAQVDLIKGRTLAEAFRIAADEDRMENGHSYSGGIGMAQGCRIVSKALPLFEAEALAQRLLGDENRGPKKWEEAHAIPVIPTIKQRTVEMELNVTGLDWQQVNAAIVKAVTPKLKAGEAIEKVEYNGLGRWSSSIEQRGTKEVKVVKTVGKGKLIKRYLVAIQHGERGQKTILGGWDTLEQAQEHATKEAERQYGDDFTIVIWPYQKREDGPLYTYKKVVTKETIHLRAIVGIPSGTPESWVVAGVYSS